MTTQVSIHRFQSGCYEYQSNEVEKLSNENVVAPDIHRINKSISFFESKTTPHLFPTTEAQKCNRCFTKTLTTETNEKIIIVSENLWLIQDKNVTLKYFLKPSSAEKRINSEQKEILHNHWSLVPRVEISVENFVNEVREFLGSFDVCSMKAQAEYFIYSFNDKSPDVQILYQCFEIAVSIHDFPPMFLWRFASALNYLESHSLEDTLQSLYYARSIFNFLQTIVRWSDFTYNQEVTPILSFIENKYNMGLDDDVEPRKYKIIENHAFKRNMNCRCSLTYSTKIAEEIFKSHIQSIIGDQEFYLEQVQSGSVKYFFSFSDETNIIKDFQTRQEAFQFENLLSIGYCPKSQTLITTVNKVECDYRVKHSIQDTSIQINNFLAIMQKFQDFIVNNTTWLPSKYKSECVNNMKELICDLPNDLDTVDTIHLSIFDNGSCEIGYHLKEELMKRFMDLKASYDENKKNS